VLFAVATVVPSSATVSRSYTVEPVSRVSTCSQKLSVAVVQSAGSVTDWLRVSVWVVP
jgi:hypothetical protein